jgi:glycosyltransferase involved in cell wall biosynthesis
LSSLATSPAAPLRVVTVVHGYPPSEHAGAELAAHWLARALLERGHDVSVFARSGDAALPELSTLRERVDGVPVTRLRTAPERAESLRATYLDARVRAAFERELATSPTSRKVDVVHVHHTIGLSIDLLDAAKRAGAKLVATLHDFWYLCPRGQRLTPWGHLCSEIDVSRCSRCIAKKRARWAWQHVSRSLVRRPLRTLAGLPGYVAENLHTSAIRRRTREIVAQLNACDLVLAPSRFVLDEHVRHGLDPRKANVLENGVDASWTAQLPPRDRADRPLRFGYVGSFLPSKGVDLLVEAFQEVPRDAATLDLFGTSPWDGGAFARRVEQSNRHPGVRFHGPFGRDRLAAVLADVDVLVVPSRWYENAPVTLDEAALAQLPTIVAAHGGMLETLERRRNGLSFRPNDVADLRAQLVRFVREPLLWSELRRPAAPVLSPAAAAAQFESLCRAF